MSSKFKKEYKIPNVIWKSLREIMRSKGSFSNKVKRIDALKPISNDERSQKEVFRHILNMHIYKQSLFSQSNINNYSEEGFKLKFCTFVFEKLFSYSFVVISV
ncbi:unnamed protein product [Rhizopus microsporus]|uniref:Uncharacterized protein n=1 Tax=Rhizopus microsporus TaxID=58291 RepID=A0A1X0RKB9_RHIZD|nr:hypothetical protein BCV71DRAFT_230327 [Rhizopus microsporus]